MKRNTLIITGIALLISISVVYAFAHDSGWSRGRGYGHMMGHDSWGPGMHGGYMYDHGGYYDNLSAEEIANLDQQRSEFFKETENTRQKLYEKELALGSELAKEDPDTSKDAARHDEQDVLKSILHEAERGN